MMIIYCFFYKLALLNSLINFKACLYNSESENITFARKRQIGKETIKSLVFFFILGEFLISLDFWTIIQTLGEIFAVLLFRHQVKLFFELVDIFLDLHLRFVERFLLKFVLLFEVLHQVSDFLFCEFFTLLLEVGLEFWYYFVVVVLVELLWFLYVSGNRLFSVWNASLLLGSWDLGLRFKIELLLWFLGRTFALFKYEDTQDYHQNHERIPPVGSSFWGPLN